LRDLNPSPSKTKAPLPTTVLDSHGSLLLMDLSDGHYRFLDLAVCESLMQRHVDPDEAGFQAGR
jgi:hypothetical protein